MKIKHIILAIIGGIALCEFGAFATVNYQPFNKAKKIQEENN